MKDRSVKQIIALVAVVLLLFLLRAVWSNPKTGLPIDVQSSLLWREFLVNAFAVICGAGFLCFLLDSRNYKK